MWKTFVNPSGDGFCQELFPLSGFEQLPFLFVAAKEGFKDDTGGFEGPKEPSAPLGGG